VAYKVFTNGSVLNASEINDNLMNQSVMVFSNSTARSAALTSPVEGMITYLEDTAVYESYDGAAWIGFGGGGGILQVVSTTKTDTFTTVSTSFTDVTGLSLSITPSSASSKILVMPFVTYSNSGRNTAHFRVLRGSTPLSVGDASGSRVQSTFSATGDFNSQGYGQSQATFVFLDTPSSTSALTYKVDCRSGLGSTTTVNRLGSDSNQADFAQTVSTLTLMEVAG
jgi:hypothetical protein